MEFLTGLVYVSIFFGFFVASFYILTFISGIRKKIPQLKDSELPFATVIIPAWNEEKNVKKTMDSILSSNYPNYEVVFVDDGSKDNTYSVAKKYECDPRVRVFTKKNGGKASALNLGISKAKGEIIFTMDADTRVHSASMRRMAKYFVYPEIMAVTPAMLIDSKGNKMTLFRRLQSVEYYFGLFLRKVFSTLDSIYVTPGAFTVYRKTFFDKHGGFDVGNITEDLEMSLRIQSNGYRIENAPDAAIYTLGPAKFKELAKQRVRWYSGMIRNIYNYKHMISPKFGDLGLLVIPIGWISILLMISIVVSTLISSVSKFFDYFVFLKSINFQVGNIFKIGAYSFEKFLFTIFSNPLFIFAFFSLATMFFYVKYAESQIQKMDNFKMSFLCFVFLYAPTACYWWCKSFFKIIFKREVTWR